MTQDIVPYKPHTKGDFKMEFHIYGVTLDVCSDVAINVLTAVCEVEDYIHKLHTMPYDECGVYPQKIHDLMYEAEYSDERDSIYQYADLIRGAYWGLSNADHIAYREYAEADFLEYAKHKDEPDFDWGYYSDWHKDIYGFRPRH